MTETHRFTLRREWIGTGGIVNFIMLNPSTADDTADDPTIRKCCGFAKRWGYRGIIVTNLFAVRATDPQTLRNLLRCGEHKYATGPGNDIVIDRTANQESDLIVAAWGANASNPAIQSRVKDVLDLLPTVFHCIGKTKDGHPVHPLMAKYTDAPILFDSAVSRGEPR